MIGNLDQTVLQQLWWILCSVVGATFLFLNFVQGGQSQLWQVARNETEKKLVVNSLGLKWELTFTTLVLFGGTLFAAFPKFYATSFGGAYWVWVLILFTFIVQAVSYEFRTKENNLLGSRVYEIFLMINGTVGVFLIGAAVGTFYTGSNFLLNDYNLVTWTHPLRGLEAAFNLFNVCLGVFLVFHARTLGAMYLVNSVDLDQVPELGRRLRSSAQISFLISLPFLLVVLVSLVLMKGYGFDDAGQVALVPGKYLANLLANPLLLVMLVAGLVLVIRGVWVTARTELTRGIWCGGLGTFLVGLVILLLPAFNNTSFYPSKADLQSSLTISNASSTHYTLTIMTYVALLIPVVLAYVAYVWRAMNRTPLTAEDVDDKAAY